eukprot:EG_transcript_2141
MLWWLLHLLALLYCGTLTTQKNQPSNRFHSFSKKSIPPIAWRRVRGVIHEAYRCRNLTPPQAAFGRACLRRAHERIKDMGSKKLWVYPVSFCYPRSEALWYHNLFWNSSKTIGLREGIHAGTLRNRRVYATADEEVYLAKYASAKVVTTQKKFGWDCLRHLEILVSGALLHLHNASLLNELTMFHYPKECLTEMAHAATLPDMEYFPLREEVWNFFLGHLTCDSLMRFMIQAMDIDPCRDVPVLFLDHSLARYIDYQAASVFIGLRETFGPNLHVWKEPNYMYADWDGDYRTQYGNGMVYSMSLDPALRTGDLPSDEVVRRLRSGYYKLVVYGSAARSTPFWEEATAALPPERVWAVIGEDRPAGEEELFRSGKSLQATVFVREMQTENFQCHLSRGNQEDVVGNVTCLSGPAAAPPSLATSGTNDCLQQANTRIRSLDVSQPVFPLSLCIPTDRLARLHPLTAHRRSKPFFHWAAADAARGDIDVKELARHHFVIVNTTASASLLLLYAYATGTLPVAPLAPIPPLLLFHHPKECFQEYRRLADIGAGATPALRHAAHRFAGAHLTCPAIVRFMMRMTSCGPCTHVPILFLDRLLPTAPDPTSLAVLAGLLELLGPTVHVWRQPKYLFADQPGGNLDSPPPALTLFTHCLNASLLQADLPDHIVAERLAAGYYKVVVYGQFRRSREFLREARAHLSQAHIWAVLPAGPLADHDDARPFVTQFVHRLTESYHRCHRGV